MYKALLIAILLSAASTALANEDQIRTYYSDTDVSGCATEGPCHVAGQLQQLNNHGKVTSYLRYDQSNNAVRIKTAQNAVIDLTYNERHQFLTATTNKKTFSFEYDSDLGMLIGLTRPNGIHINYEYDAQGRLIRVFGKKNEVTYTYGTDGAVTTQVLGNSKFAKYVSEQGTLLHNLYVVTSIPRGQIARHARNVVDEALRRQGYISNHQTSSLRSRAVVSGDDDDGDSCKKPPEPGDPGFEDYCRDVRNEAIVACLPFLPTTDVGFTYWNCINAVLEAAGCQ
jgi:YD repeat-containing protein